jgi:uracil-DNA glycosylase
MTTTSMPLPISPSLPKRNTVSGTIRAARILLVGEAPTEQDERQGMLFTGSAGQELTSMLVDAGIRRAECALTNVFDQRPPGGDLGAWSVKRAEVTFDPMRPWAWIPAAKQWLPGTRVQPALERLRTEINAVQPNVIIALGNTAIAALTGSSGIGKIRGTLYQCRLSGRKVIGTYHPSAVLRQYEFRGIVEADFLKAKAESEFPDMRLRKRTLYLAPTIADLAEWRNRLVSAPALAVDCETRNGQITCVGFAPSPDEAFVIPFWDRRKPGWHYWPDAESERFAWQVCHDILVSPAEKILQNGLYDMQYFLLYRWPMRRFIQDTMLKHHSLYPGLPKGLDFLGSLYANERAWKKFRPRGGEEKKDS